jgi:hypothetical protein
MKKMKTKTVERLINETPEHIKQQVSEYADNIVKNKYISYSCVGVANNIYKLEIVTEDGLMLFEGDLADCQAQINYMNSKN